MQKALLSRVIFKYPFYVSFRCAWNKDWKPAPYPKTPEERAKAAAKYGLNPADYEPVPDDGFGVGDYPNITQVSYADRDPYHDWDDRLNRRDYFEPINRDYFDYYYPLKVDQSSRKHKSFRLIIYRSLTPIVVLSILAYLLRDLRYITPVLPKQFPIDAISGKEKHYLFEPPDPVDN